MEEEEFFTICGEAIGALLDAVLQSVGSHGIPEFRLHRPENVLGSVRCVFGEIFMYLIRIPTFCFPAT